MKYCQKLKLIKKLSELTQEKLAKKLGVSFVTFNSWINDRSMPHKKNQERINDLYCDYTGQKIIPENILDAKKEIIYKKAKKYKNIIEEIVSRPDLFNQFVLSFTYNTNSIEGSTLTKNETFNILFENKSVPNKSLTEHLETKNHQTALEILFRKINNDFRIDETFILRLHGILMSGIRQDAGFYRNHSVRIVGTNVPTVNHLKIPDLMKALIREINNTKKDIIEHISMIHARFEQIHPFSDGNGRIGRLLLQTMLLQKNLPLAIINANKKNFYYKYLQKAQLKNDSSLLEDFLCDAIIKGFELLEK